MRVSISMADLFVRSSAAARAHTHARTHPTARPPPPQSGRRRCSPQQHEQEAVTKVRAPRATGELCCAHGNALRPRCSRQRCTAVATAADQRARAQEAECACASANMSENKFSCTKIGRHLCTMLLLLLPMLLFVSSQMSTDKRAGRSLKVELSNC